MTILMVLLRTCLRKPGMQDSPTWRVGKEIVIVNQICILTQNLILFLVVILLTDFTHLNSGFNSQR